ncbi:unnamed protein product [Caenorhabditis auriculariae]|uniref:Uncharacterized protein n=1 Tax=Caenorhabditis auriculariae TaxID=2777116 RepID=A0A8S1HNN9_9PELO|nr:unnamed protein product [Caenorhabditis auriculariae]
MSETESLKEGGIKLKPRISLFNGCTIIIGVIIGSGIFVSPKGVLIEAGSAGASLAVWFLSGVFAMVGALCYAELGTTIPKSGGDYAYIHEAFGALPSFLFLWVALVILSPTTIAIMAITFATYALQPIYGTCTVPEEVASLLAAAIIFLVTFVNCYDVRAATRTNDFFTIAKVLALIIIIVAGIVWLFLGNLDYLQRPEVLEGTKLNPSSLSLAFYSGVFSFSGFSYLNFVTEELKEPFKNLPRAIYISIPAVTIIYMLVNIAYFSVLSVDEILDSSAVAVTFAEKLMGKGAILIPVFVACSCIGSLNGVMFTCSRMFFAGARIGQMPELLAMISIKRFTPMPSLIFLGASSIAMLFIGDVFVLINYLSFAESLVVFASVAGLIKMRITHPDLHRPIRLNMLIPLSFFCMCLFLLIFPFFQQPGELFIGVAIVLSGIPVYLLFVYNTHKPAFLYKPWIWFTHFIQKLLYCVPETSKSN